MEALKVYIGSGKNPEVWPGYGIRDKKNLEKLVGLESSKQWGGDFWLIITDGSYKNILHFTTIHIEKNTVDLYAWAFNELINFERRLKLEQI
jgi:hypothetical protein